ncbi:YceD family protein [Catenovulum sediminis]|nr:YceD family protein [Catenovulum sediminis]
MPIEIDPVKSAQKRSDYNGVYQLEDLTRLSASILSGNGQVNVTLRCTYDEQRLPVMLITAETDVEVKCERCGEPMQQHLGLSATFTPKTYRLDEDLVPSDYAIVAVNEYGLLDLRALIEDELLLEIPIVPKHKVDECAIKEQDMSWGELDEAAQEKPASPFDVLKSLKNPK